MLLSTLRDLIPGLSYEHQISHLALKLGHPLIILAVLIIASRNEKGGARHGPESLDGGIRVGSLGIVIIPDPGALPYELDSVLHRMKALNDPCNVRHGNPHLQGNGCRRHGILIIMASQKLHVMNIDHNGLTAALAVHDIIPVHAETVL